MTSSASLTLSGLLLILETWKDRLHLSHWDIQIDWDEPADSGCHAQIAAQPQRQLAFLNLEEDWERWTNEMANEILCHELLHCAHRDTDYALYDGIDGGILSNAAEHLIKQAYDRAMERFIDDHSRILVKGYGCVVPKPEPAKKPRARKAA